MLLTAAGDVVMTTPAVFFVQIFCLHYFSFYNMILPMSQDQLIKLACKTCKRVNYYSRKNKKKVERKIELKKFCKWCKKNTPHKEAKK